MFNSLNTKLTLSLVLLALVICSSYGFISYQYILKQQLADKQILNRQLATDLVKELDWLPSDRLDADKWQQRLQSFMSINPGVEIYLLDLIGNIVATGGNERQLTRLQIDVRPLEQHIIGDHMYPLIGQDPTTHDLDKPFTVAPVPNAELPQGYLYVVLNSQQQQEFEADKKANYYWMISMYILAVSLSIGFLIAVLFFRTFTRRIKNLSSAVKHFRDSDFGHNHYQPQLQADYRNDEIGYLNQSFDSMAQQIQLQMTQIQSVDENRRNLLAGISHDLRTPLTALRGYLEILQTKSLKLSQEQNREYLNICIKNAVRMGDMIEDIFQLSRLQANEIQLQSELFSIQDLAQDVLINLKPIAQNKGIDIVLDLCSDSIPSIYADISLIERVLENLICNAIHHTDSGTIELSIQQSGDKVKISVSDSGLGIAIEDQQKIFLPYYQGKAITAGSSKRGLGLAICDKILNLHEQQLSLISEPGKGSCFFFYLGSTQPNTV